MFFVYVIYNERSSKIYIGQTNNLEKRLKEHNSKRGNHFTAKFDRHWVLIYKEEVVSRNEALIKEKQSEEL